MNISSGHFSSQEGIKIMNHSHNMLFQPKSCVSPSLMVVQKCILYSRRAITDPFYIRYMINVSWLLIKAVSNVPRVELFMQKSEVYVADVRCPFDLPRKSERIKGPSISRAPDG